jgi:hypothetical protein
MSDQTSQNSWLIRAARFASIIIVLAVLFGGAFALFDYVRQFTENDRRERDRSSQAVERDTIPMLRMRFYMGAGIGSVIGLIYAGRCMIKKQEP